MKIFNIGEQKLKITKKIIHITDKVSKTIPVKNIETISFLNGEQKRINIKTTDETIKLDCSCIDYETMNNIYESLEKIIQEN